ncbi:MAG: hypothetical protein MZU95_09390 [Desulfomicrobium escambiense]|nr:hypothetical protein [Desulfomicrobium escambiense]
MRRGFPAARSSRRAGGRVSPSRLDRVPAPLLVLVSIASVQTGSAVARTLFDDLGAPGVTLLRLGLAAVVLLVVLRPRVHRWSRRSWTAALLLGAVFAGMNSAFYLSLRTVPLGVAVTVEFLGPLVLALVQTRRLVDLMWALLAGAGVALLGLDSTSGIAVSGLLLAGLAGVFWAVYILASARVGQGCSQGSTVWPSRWRSRRCSCCRSVSTAHGWRSPTRCCSSRRRPSRCCRRSSRTGWN